MYLEKEEKILKKIHNIIKTINERFNKINFYGHTYLSEGDRFLYIMFHSELTDLKTYNSFYIKLLKEALKDKYNNLNECNITNLKPLEENDNYFFLEQHLFLGHIILLDSKDEKFYYLDFSNAPHRNTSLPPGDTSNSDAHDGLVESILINESLLRKRLKSTSIKSIGYTVGDVTKTNVNILYHEKMKNTKVLSKIKEKPSSIILLDEIDKAHPTVINLLYQILDEGIVKDAKNSNMKKRYF